MYVGECWAASLSCLRVVDGDSFFNHGQSGVGTATSKGVSISLAPSKLKKLHSFGAVKIKKKTCIHLAPSK